MLRQDDMNSFEAPWISRRSTRPEKERVLDHFWHEIQRRLLLDFGTFPEFLGSADSTIALVSPKPAENEV